MAESVSLSKGMKFDEVKQVLRGWNAEPAGAVMSADKLHLFHTWDFFPPAGSGAKPLRLTLENWKLLFWGEPAPFRAPESDLPEPM